MDSSPGLSFRVIVENVPEADLLASEYEWTIALEGINKPPTREVRRETQRIICLDIEAGDTYREIAYKHSVSLGTVAAIKAKYRIAVNREQTQILNKLATSPATDGG